MTRRLAGTALLMGAIFGVVWWQASLFAAVTAVGAAAVTLALGRLGR